MEHYGLEYLIDPLLLAKRKNHRSILASSYDRRGGNHDWSNYVRREGTAAAMVKAEGPGCFTRIWTADPQKGIVRFFFDGSDKPAIECKMADLFKYLPLSFGIGGESPENYKRRIDEKVPMGHTSYCPIPFAKSCVVTIDPEDDYLYYHFNYNQYMPGTKVQTFEPMTSLSTPLIQSMQGVWKKWDAGESLVNWESAQTYEVNLNPGEAFELHVLEGPGIVRGIQISMPPLDDPRVVEHRRETLWLLAHIDLDERLDPSIRVPVGPFFLDYGQNIKPRSFMVGTDADGNGYCTFPMPFEEKAAFKLENRGMIPFTDIKVRLLVDSVEHLDDDYLRFRATWHYETPFGPDHRDYSGVACRLLNLDGRDNYEILNVRGGGHFVGCGIQLDLREAPTDRAACEGDEMFYIDDDPRYTMYGTGCEDYLNDAWGLNEYMGAMSGDCLLGEWTKNSQMVGYRMHLADPVPFIRKGRFTLEHGTGNNCSGLYRSVAYWYTDLTIQQTKVEERHWEEVGKST
jgi:hypothetical protein